MYRSIMPLRKLSAILLSQLVAASVHRPSSRKLDYCVVYDENVFVHAVVKNGTIFLRGCPLVVMWWKCSIYDIQW